MAFIALWLLLGVAVTTAFVEIVRRGPAWLWVVVFGVVALVVPALSLFQGGSLELFTLVKTVSVGAAGLGIAALRFEWVRPKLAQRYLWVVLAINVLEAAATGVSGGYWLNPLVGLVLIVTLAAPDVLAVDRERSEVNWQVGWDWVLLYSLWNAVFIYCSAPPGEGRGIWMWVAILHLVVPIVMTLGRAERFLELRTLALFIVVCWVDSVRTEPWVVHSNGIFSESIASGLQIFSFVAGCAVLLRHLLDPRAPRSLARHLGRSA